MNTALTGLISAAYRGDSKAVGCLWATVYDQVHAMAEGHLRREHGGQSLQATELVNEVYLKIAPSKDIPCEDRRYFFGMLANAMEQVLAEHSRARRRKKRGGDVVRVSLSGEEAAPDDPTSESEALSEAIRALVSEDPRCGEIVRLRVYGGRKIAEVAELMKMPIRSVEREWRFGRLWLIKRLGMDDSE